MLFFMPLDDGDMAIVLHHDFLFSSFVLSVSVLPCCLMTTTQPVLHDQVYSSVSAFIGLQLKIKMKPTISFEIARKFLMYQGDVIYHLRA
jgi:hypothetical protein